jgi:hypothetical protein
VPSPASGAEAVPSPGVGTEVAPPPSLPRSPEPPPSAEGAGASGEAGAEFGEAPVVGAVPRSGLPEPALCPLKASPTVVLVPSPLKLCPETDSYVVIPAIVTPKTRAVATSGLFQLLTRAR